MVVWGGSGGWFRPLEPPLEPSRNHPRNRPENRCKTSWSQGWLRAWDQPWTYPATAYGWQKTPATCGKRPRVPTRVPQAALCVDLTGGLLWEMEHGRGPPKRKHSLEKNNPFLFKVESRKGQPFAAWDRAAFVHERRREGVLTTIFPVSFATPFFPSPSSSPFPWRGCHLLLPDPVLSIFLVSPLFFALAQNPSWLGVES